MSWGDRPPTGPIPQDRIIRLLETRRPVPGRRDWDARRWALQKAEPHAIPILAARIEDEITAMEAARDARYHRERKASDEDWQAALQCEMRAPNVRGLTERECGERRVCFLCGKWPIPKRRQHWCSDECVDRWFQSHEWTAARNQRLRTDANRCVRCGKEREEVVVCVRCRTAWPCEPTTRGSVYGNGQRYMPGHYQQTIDSTSLQVNHMDPRYGRGYHKGCHNHQDRLETLCAPCHQIETNAQREARAKERTGALAKSIGLDWDGGLSDAWSEARR